MFKQKISKNAVYNIVSNTIKIAEGTDAKI